MAVQAAEASIASRSRRPAQDSIYDYGNVVCSAIATSTGTSRGEVPARCFGVTINTAPSPAVDVTSRLLAVDVIAPLLTVDITTPSLAVDVTSPSPTVGIKKTSPAVNVNDTSPVDCTTSLNACTWISPLQPPRSVQMVSFNKVKRWLEFDNISNPDLTSVPVVNKNQLRTSKPGNDNNQNVHLPSDISFYGCSTRSLNILKRSLNTNYATKR
jgi:hypothetical protein